MRVLHLVDVIDPYPLVLRRVQPPAPPSAADLEFDAMLEELVRQRTPPVVKRVVPTTDLFGRPADGLAFNAWRTGNPPQPGVYYASQFKTSNVRSLWDGESWSDIWDHRSTGHEIQKASKVKKPNWNPYWRYMQ